jgi:PAS domain S-box-containing protein
MAAITPHTILHVDDNDIGRYSVTRILEQAGFQVIEASTGREALELARQLPDLVLLDVNLPDIDGFEVCRHLKSDPVTRLIPVLHISAERLDSDSAVAGLLGGGDGYLTQPVKPDVLVAHVKSLIRNYDLEKQLIRTNRALKALSYCNQAVLRARSVSELTQEVCRVLVEIGGYRFVWVGVKNDDPDKTIRVMARWGESGDLFEGTNLSWAERTTDCCPMGEAIRTGKPSTIQDMINECQYEPSRSKAMKTGIVAAYALPLVVKGEIWGGISLLSQTAGTEDREERELLSQLGQDLSYGIESFLNREKARDTELALLESEERFRLAFENANIGVCLVGSDGRFLRVNDEMCRILGYDQHELESMTVSDVTHPEDLDVSTAFIEGAVAGKIDSSEFEKRYIHKKGHVVWGVVASSLIRDTHGNPRYFISHLLDVTEARSSEERRTILATVIEQAAEIVVITDTLGSIEYVNPAFERITGYSSPEVLGKNPRILKSGEHDAVFYKTLWDTINSGSIWTGSFINKKKDGSLFQEDATISPVKNASGKIVRFVAVKRDVTESVELTKQLFQAQKMEAVGTLAGGIAHDFNNILQVALGYSEIMRNDPGLTERQKTDLNKIHIAAQRGADLVQRLLTFSRKTETRPQPLNLNHRIEELRKMIERAIPKMIDIQLVLNKDLYTINADPTQIDQVLMNLCVNARDAMPDGGKLIIETANIIFSSEYARSHLHLTPGNYALLSVTDSGLGMDKETLDHMFEPFFTTKQVGEGTGLGLATVHGIVKSHGGHIHCYSEPGKGTIFKIYFPALEDEEQQESAASEAAPQGGSETILLVDDDDAIRDIGSKLLTQVGYQVLTACNGKEGLDIYKTYSQDIAIVLLDLGMPEMGGKRCLQGLLAFNPDVKVVVVSGYSARKEAFAAGAKDFVGKPYSVGNLLKTIRSVMDQS